MVVLLKRGLIVQSATDIVVMDHRGGRRRRGHGLVIEALFQNGFQTFIRARADLERSPARCFQALRPIAFTQAHDA